MSKLFTYIFNKRQTSVFPMKFTLEVSGFWQRPNEVNPGQVPHATYAFTYGEFSSSPSILPSIRA